MVADFPSKFYVVTIYGTTYAGNYEREICAYCTGVVGDCDVGKKYREIFKKEVKYDGKYPDAYVGMEECMMNLSDDHGCYRPVALNDDTNACDIFFRKVPTDVQIRLICKRAKKFFEEYGDIFKCTKNEVAKLKKIVLKKVTVNEEIIRTVKK